jgi:hypothetical protein
MFINKCKFSVAPLLEYFMKYESFSHQIIFGGNSELFLYILIEGAMFGRTRVLFLCLANIYVHNF